MANRKMSAHRKTMEGGKGKAHTKKPTPTAIYKERSAKPEPDMIRKKPARKRFGPPKGFI